MKKIIKLILGTIVILPLYCVITLLEWLFEVEEKEKKND